MKAWRLGRSSFCSGRKYFSYRPSSTGLTDMAACARRGNNPQLRDRKREGRENETRAQKLQATGQPKGVFRSSQPSTLVVEVLACQETVTMNCWPRAGGRQYARYTPT